jgi:hypothetical protein
MGLEQYFGYMKHKRLKMDFLEHSEWLRYLEQLAEYQRTGFQL